MKTRFLLALVALAAIATLIYGYTRLSREQAADAQGDAPIVAPSKVEREGGGGTVVRLDLPAQKLIGLATTYLAAATLPPEVRGYGRVLDPTPLLGLVGDLASAQVASAASSKEFQRVTGLFHQGANASAKTMEAAEAAMQRDQIALRLAENRLLSEWGGGVAGEPDLPAFVESLATRQSTLVRLELPAGETVPATPVGARLAAPGNRAPIEARFLGRATATDPQVQGEGFLFLVTNAPAVLAPGLAVTGFFQLPGEPAHGVVVPDDAVVRSAERAWVYAQTGDTTFARREITLDRPVAGGWFVTNGVAPAERVVVTGAQTLLSEERKGQIKVGD